MYVTLTDGDSPSHNATVPYDGDINDITGVGIPRVAKWLEWNIKLADFTDVNLANVKRITIGFGNKVKDPPQNRRYVYFDDIRLYPPRCVFAKRDLVLNGWFTKLDYAPPSLDIPGDCVIDSQELEIMARDWLVKDAYLPTKDPNIAGGLWAYYPLDNDDPNDANGVFGHVTDSNCDMVRFDDPEDDVNHITWVPGLFGPSDANGAVHFDGYPGSRIETCDSDPVGDWNTVGTRTGNLTVAIWEKWEGPRKPAGNQSQGLICKRGGWDDATVRFMFEMDTPPASAGQHDPPVGWTGSFSLRSYCTSWYSPKDAIVPFLGQWAHLAATCQGHTVRLYLNGREIPHEELIFRNHVDCPLEEFSFGLGLNADITLGNTNSNSAWGNGPGVYNGTLDEARIYNRALEPNEIARLADISPGDGELYVAVASPAELYNYEDEGERAIDFKDFAYIAEAWLTDAIWP
jgi:hypothetical protein